MVVPSLRSSIWADFVTAPGVGTTMRPPRSAIRAVASLGIRAIITGSKREGCVLGGSGHTAWVETSDGVMVITDRGGPRLPNGIEIIPPRLRTEVGVLLPPGSLVTVGQGTLDARMPVAVTRWWDPSPSVGTPAAAEVAERIEALPDSIEGVTGCEVASAIEAGRADAVVAAADRILGRGSGLTPEADDYVAGMLASVRIVGPATGDLEAAPLLGSIAAPLSAIASRRTTSLSASLLGHAVRGEVAAPAGAFLRAVCGRGDVEATHRSVTDIGHSSGPALAAGMVLGLRTVVERVSRRTGGVHR